MKGFPSRVFLHWQPLLVNTSDQWLFARSLLPTATVLFCYPLISALMMSRLMKQMYCHCFQKLFFLQRTLSWTSEFPLKTLLFQAICWCLTLNKSSDLTLWCDYSNHAFFLILASIPPVFLVAKFLMNMLLSFVPECLHLQSVVSTVWGSIWTCTPDCHTIENTCRHALLTDYTCYSSEG